MEQVKIGARGPIASRLLFGTLTMGPNQRNLPPERGAELIVYAASKGVTFLDTAEYYHTYPHVKLALKERPDLVVCTKSYAYDTDGAKRSLELAQEGIGREYIDIFLMHEQESELTMRGHREAFDYYRLMRERGVIGAIGISTHYVAAARYAAHYPDLDILFPLINRRGLGIVDGTREQMEEAIWNAHCAGIGILAMKALGGGHMIEDRERAFQYIRSLPGVDAVAVGMQSEAEIDYNAALFSGETPDVQSARESAGANRTLIIQDWCEGCGRCVKRCGQHALHLDAQTGRAVVDEALCVRCGYCAAVCPQFCLKVI
ncbi:MAG TPA: aldo/keto reductase [Candidatus Aphodomonas merdavium]|nr:aldo/keto reductase [Candidatus Aphodomonas merdavium]